jgi:hypothetical protein
MFAQHPEGAALDRPQLHLPEAVLRRAVHVLGGLPIVPEKRLDGLPDTCSVLALGTGGFASFFLAATGELVSVPCHVLAARDIKRLFAGRSDWAARVWQRRSADGVVVGIHTHAAGLALTTAAMRVGKWPDAPRQAAEPKRRG